MKPRVERQLERGGIHEGESWLDSLGQCRTVGSLLKAQTGSGGARPLVVLQWLVRVFLSGSYRPAEVLACPAELLPCSSEVLDVPGRGFCMDNMAAAGSVQAVRGVRSVRAVQLSRVAGAQDN